MKNLKPYISLIIIALLIFGCSRDKNRLINRKYHDTTARFNGYFNAKESVKEGKMQLEMNYRENWDEILPLFIYGDEESSKSVYPQMDRAIEKCSKVITNHSMQFKNKEVNKWVDDCYLLIGIANFYKKSYIEADEMFKYVTKKYKKDPNKYWAGLWMARMNIEEKEFAKAGAVLSKLEEEMLMFPKNFLSDYLEVYSDYYIKQKDWPNAIDKIQLAINEEKTKKRKTRLTFILAQIYQEKGDSQKAIRTYAQVVKMNPEYEMEFYSKINQALAFDSKSDSKYIRDELDKLLRDDNNLEFQDQIYFALAEVEFVEQNYDEAIKNLLKSAEVSVNNNKQKGKSYLKLADFYFEERKYEEASPFYDSTVVYLPKDYPDYDVINAKTESLSELVKNIEIIYGEDSLQAFLEFDESTLDKKLQSIIRKLERDEEEKNRLEEERKAADLLADLDNKNEKGPNVKGSWYFYNPAAKSIGFSDFRTKFGNRKLEDNWRRNDKQQFDSFEEATAEIESGTINSNIPTLEELKINIPFSYEQKKASDERIITAFYKLGSIYKEQLNDIDNSIESFEELVARYDTGQVALQAYYQLYRLYLVKEEGGNFFSDDYQSSSTYYKDKLISDYPTSDYAQLITNPDYVAQLDKARQENLLKYEETYREYRRRNYNDVMVACLDVINNDPKNALIAKYSFLRAMAIAGRHDRENYIKALRDIVADYPGTEESTEAKLRLGLLVSAEDLKTILDNEPIEIEEEKPKEEPVDLSLEEFLKDSPFALDPEGEHYFALIVPNEGADINDIKNTISDYNEEFFRNDDLKVTNSFINSESQIIMIRKFKDQMKGMNYYNTFSFNGDLLSEINGGSFPYFAISTKNFATLFKTKNIDGYLEFFNKVYVK